MFLPSLKERLLGVLSKPDCDVSVSKVEDLAALRRAGRIMSKGAVLVIVWAYLIVLSFINLITEIPIGYHVLTRIASGVVVLLSPFAGLTASIYFSRYKVLLTGLWCMWTGNICVAAIIVLLSLHAETNHQVVEYSLILPMVLHCTGFALLWVNVVPFGLDQMPDASSEQIKAFIKWLVWAICAGFVTAGHTITAHHCAHLPDLDTNAILSLLSAALLSLILCSNYLQKGWLVIEPVSRNPLRNVYLTVRFAVRHQHPVRRSAFTYCEDKQPSRLDLAKSKYGGPFTTEEVEDVKTCLRMTVVIFCSIFIISPGVALLLSMGPFFDTEFTKVEIPICYIYLLSNSNSLLLLPFLFPAVYKLLNCSLLRKWIPGILKGICITQALGLIIGVIMLLCSTIWYMKHTSAECMFNYEEVSPFPVKPYWLEIPLYFLFVLFFFFVLIRLLEFVCAQAPYAQKGLLLGLVYSALIVSFGLGELFYKGWEIGYQRAGSTSAICGVWFYLFVTITAILVCLMWCCLAKWYKKRQRDEPDRAREYVENYYDHYCSLGSP